MLAEVGQVRLCSGGFGFSRGPGPAHSNFFGYIQWVGEDLPAHFRFLKVPGPRPVGWIRLGIGGLGGARSRWVWFGIVQYIVQGVE